jgi:hypothetical protein
VCDTKNGIGWDEVTSDDRGEPNSFTPFERRVDEEEEEWVGVVEELGVEVGAKGALLGAEEEVGEIAEVGEGFGAEVARRTVDGRAGDEFGSRGETGGWGLWCAPSGWSDVEAGPFTTLIFRLRISSSSKMLTF